MKNYMKNLFEKIKNNAKKIYYQGRLKVYQNNMRNTRKVMKKIIGKNKSLVIRQKGESQNGLQENKARQIFRKTNISYPLIRIRACAYQGIRNVSFSENLACFDFF